MRQTALARRPQKIQPSQGVALPAPVGGWDGISPLANMPLDRAYQLDNWIARPGWIEPRKGFLPQSTGLGSSHSPVQSVMAYNGFGKNRLFAVSDGVIYDCTVPGKAVATIANNLGSSRLQHIMFSNPSGTQYLIAANGVNKPWMFDGSVWSQPLITGYGGANLLLVNVLTETTGNLLRFASVNASAINTSADTASGNTLPFISTTGVQVGYYVIGPNIPVDATVASVTSTTVVLSANITDDVPAGSVIWFSPSAGTTGVKNGYYAVGVNIPDGTAVTSVTPTSVSLAGNITGTIQAGTLIQFNPTATQAGFDPSTFVGINAYAERIWYVQDASTDVVYMQTIGGVSGPASKFPLGQLMRYGGYIMAIGTWTIDTRQTVDEYIAFITSRGEVIVYAGTDPSTANTWQLVGVYKIGAPIGRRCFLRISGDLQIITVDGIVGMSEMLSTDRAAANRVSLTSIIMNPIATAAQDYKNNFGWQLIEYPLGTLAILNVPVQENSVSQQFVMNTITGAWSRFIGLDQTGTPDSSYGINANCWEVDASDNIYFGGNDGTVYQWNVGGGDNTKSITCLVKGAYNNFGNGAQIKNYQMLQPLITTTGTPIPAIGINVDFNDSLDLSTEEPQSAASAKWNEVTWNNFKWGGGPTTTNNWVSVQGLGHYVSIVTQVTTTPSVSDPTYAPVIRLNGWNIIAQSGNFV